MILLGKQYVGAGSEWRESAAAPLMKEIVPKFATIFLSLRPSVSIIKGGNSFIRHDNKQGDA